MSNDDDLKKLKEKRNDLINQAAKAAHDYAKELELGEERIRAFEIYENVLYSTRS